MLPVRVGDQVARPTVRNFVDDYVREASVPGEERRRNKRQAGIFHPPVGERPWHAQDIVAPPFVGPRILERVPIVAIERKLEVRGGWTRRFAVSQCRHDRSERVWCRYRRRVRCLHAPGVSWQRRKDRA